MFAATELEALELGEETMHTATSMIEGSDLDQSCATVDVDDLSGDVAGLLTGEEGHGVGDVGR